MQNVIQDLEGPYQPLRAETISGSGVRGALRRVKVQNGYGVLGPPRHVRQDGTCQAIEECYPRENRRVMQHVTRALGGF